MHMVKYGLNAFFHICLFVIWFRREMLTKMVLKSRYGMQVVMFAD